MARKRLIPVFSSLRSSSQLLGPLEQRLLEGLWARGTATVRELIQDGYQDLAYTTVMTTLDRLFKKGLLARSVEGVAFRYVPRFSRVELHRTERRFGILRLSIVPYMVHSFAADAVAFTKFDHTWPKIGLRVLFYFDRNGRMLQGLSKRHRKHLK